VYVDLSPSWSPDGSSITFVSDRDGKADIWLMDMSTEAATRLTDTPAPANAPVWSPDGRKIAYLADAINSIFIAATVNVLDIKSGEMIAISGPLFGPSAPAWSPDGSKVAVYSRHPMSDRFREGLNAIYLLPSSGVGENLWVTPVPGISLGRRQFNRPAWSTDGDMVFRIAGELWTVPLTPDGSMGDAVKIADAGENPNWSGSGSRLIYVDGADIKLYERATGVTRGLDISPEWQRILPDAAMTVRAGRLFDGLGESYRENLDIVIENGVITAIRPAGESEPQGEFIDASAKVVIPGLIESHTHQSRSQGVALSRLWLCHGITSVRETGGDPYYAVERREAEAAGRHPGPRVFTAGPLNEGARVSYGVSETVGTPERAQDTVRLSTELELDVYKSYVRQDYDVQKRVIELAHQGGIPVSSHELYPSVANGIDQMEHFGATSRRGYSLKMSRLGNSYQDVISLITRSGVVVTPTLALSSGGDKRDISSQMVTIKKIVDGGGHIVAGTDSPFVPHADSLHRELEIYVEAGLTPARALRSATSDAADALGAGDQIGAITPGLMADIVVLDGDPLTDITHTRTVDTVIKNGAVVCAKPE
jgi:hypothetical protein